MRRTREFWFVELKATLDGMKVIELIRIQSYVAISESSARVRISNQKALKFAFIVNEREPRIASLNAGIAPAFQ